MVRFSGCFCILLFVLFIATNGANADISSQERQALIDFYNSTNGDDWLDNSGWKNEPGTDGFAMPGTECGWVGVFCNNDTVVEITLDDNNLMGIPLGLGGLANLRSLSLSDNQLTGIPAEFGNLANLVFLLLYGNQLTDIPAQLGNLIRLEYLYLDTNRITSIPVELGKLVKLTFLYFDNNELTRIPSELGNLENLEVLYLDSNKLEQIPADFGNLTHLVDLRLDNNRLTGSLPLEILELTSLINIDVCNNHLSISDESMRTFLDDLQPGWEDCQVLERVGYLPFINLLLLN